MGEDHRTYAAAPADFMPRPGIPRYNKRYNVRYPLREWGLSRADCGRLIVDEGLPLPPKSACFFCPSAKLAELHELAATEPVYWRMALEMERVYRAGAHFRGDHTFVVSARHKETGEKVRTEIYARTAALARDIFRFDHDDTRKPYRYVVDVNPVVVGLGRKFAWAGVELPMVNQ